MNEEMKIEYACALKYGNAYPQLFDILGMELTVADVVIAASEGVLTEEDTPHILKSFTVDEVKELVDAIKELERTTQTKVMELLEEIKGATALGRSVIPLLKYCNQSKSEWQTVDQSTLKLPDMLKSRVEHSIHTAEAVKAVMFEIQKANVCAAYCQHFVKQAKAHLSENKPKGFSNLFGR